MDKNTLLDGNYVLLRRANLDATNSSEHSSSLSVPDLYVIQSLDPILFDSQCPEFGLSVLDTEPVYLRNLPLAIATRKIPGLCTTANDVDRSAWCRRGV